jgi:predicted transcriptional regulator
MAQIKDKRAVVLSVRHPYSELLVSGAKRIELRRKFPEDLPAGTRALIYASGTTKAVIGECEIAGVERLPISRLWKETAIHSMISWRDFKEYFHDLDEGYAVRMVKPRRYTKPIPLSDIFPDKSEPRPPQSYCYLEPGL